MQGFDCILGNRCENQLLFLVQLVLAPLSLQPPLPLKKSGICNCLWHYLFWPRNQSIFYLSLFLCALDKFIKIIVF